MMKRISRKPRRGMVAAALGLAGLLFLSVPQTALAQQMHDDGFTLPWFYSRAERLERQACIDRLPECRPSVRREIENERLATRYTPWLLLGGLVLAVLFYVRQKDKQRERRRAEALRHHTRSPRRDRGGGEARPAAMADTDEEGLGMGHPGDH
jgi:hypothetical protein